MRCWPVLLMLTFGCATTSDAPSGERTTNLSASDQLKRYGFAACLEADGMKNQSVSRSLAFIMEVSKAPLWKFPQLAGCASAYVNSRRSSLTTDLGIEKCLDFMESPQLASAVAAKEDVQLSCTSTHHVVEPGRPPAID
jgi:hypothetical protein